MRECAEGGVQLLNNFALVTYIPEPLRSFLDALRRELAPDCFPQAHVTILPPRPLLVSPEEAWETMRPLAEGFPSFEIAPAEVELFEASPVVYIALGAGRDELLRLHERLNCGCLEFPEPFFYHPHITLAQDLPRQQIEELFPVAQRRWAKYSCKAPFRVRTVTFVQNTSNNLWVDLAECSLATPGATSGRSSRG